MRGSDYLATYPLPRLLPGEKHSLAIRVARRRLAEVVWDGKPLASEGAAALDQVSIADSHGELGIYVSGAGCLIHRANLHIEPAGEAP
jgi:hypothetical protein